MECVRPAHADLEGYFKKRATRRVALDCTVSLAGRLYEAPVPLVGKQIILLYHGPDRVEVLTAPTGGSLFTQNQTLRSATHETKLPRLLCPHQGALRP
ncbi:hypothetical protein DFAR_970017 [Desulfarculales bacterium]